MIPNVDKEKTYNASVIRKEGLLIGKRDGTPYTSILSVKAVLKEHGFQKVLNEKSNQLEYQIPGSFIIEHNKKMLS